MKKLTGYLTLGLLLCTGASAHNVDADLSDSIASHYDSHLKDLFVHFHQNPELSLIEHKTADRMAEELEALGYDVTNGVGETGVVAVLENGDGPTIMLRADSDGLPVEEKSGLSYASKATQVDVDGVEKPVMHACGHDVHITSLVGTAKQMMDSRDHWSGTLVLIVQPAEEKISGARKMLEDGLYTRFPKPDYALAFHVWAQGEAGKIVVPEAAAYSSSDSVDIYVYGVGAHGASPHRGIDPVLIASQIVVSLQTIVSRSIAPLDPGVITVGAIHGGSKHNIIGEEVHLQLTVRSDDPKVRTQLLDGIDRVAKGVAYSMGVPEDKIPKVVRSKTQTTPPTVNDTETALFVKEALSEAMGEDVLQPQIREGMGAEDFAYFITPESGVKGVYFVVGGTDKDDLDTAASHHSPYFKVEPEPSIKIGTEAMVSAATALFNREE